MAVLVKICGITTLADAQCALDAGADALGFIFFRRSPRYIEPRAASAITSKIPATILKIGVFVDEHLDTIQRIALESGLDRLQLHGNESSQTCALLRTPVIKAFRV